MPYLENADTVLVCCVTSRAGHSPRAGGDRLSGWNWMELVVVYA